MGPWIPLSLFAVAGLLLADCRSGRSSETIRPFERDEQLDRLMKESRCAEAMAYANAELRSRAEQAGPMDPETLLRLERAASTSFDCGDTWTGTILVEAAVRGYRSVLPPHDPRLATALLLNAAVTGMLRERDRTERLFEETRRLLKDAGPGWDVERSFLERIEGSAWRRKDPERSIKLLESSFRRLQGASADPRVPFERADSEIWLGWILNMNGRSAEASLHYRQARETLLRLGLSSHSLNVVIDNDLAANLAVDGRWEEAEPFFRESAAISDGNRQKFPPGLARMHERIEAYDFLALIAARQGRFEEAWRLVEWGRAATHVDLAILGLWRDRDPETFRPAQTLRGEVLVLRHALERDLSRGLSAWEHGTWERTLKFLDVQQQLHVLETRYFQASSGLREPSLPRVQALLSPETAFVGVLEVTLAGELNPSRPRAREGWIYIVRSTGPVVWVPLGADDLEGRAGAWLRMLWAASWPFHVDLDPKMMSDGRVLARRYFDPALPYLHGIEHVVYEGAYLGPIEMMIGPDGRYVGDWFDVSYVPSAHVASLLARRHSNRSHGKPGALLAVSAAPAADRTESLELLAAIPKERRDFRRLRDSFPRRTSTLGELTSLPLAGAEVSSVAQKFPRATVLQGPAGVERRLSEVVKAGGLTGYDVLHFAGHSLADVIVEHAGLALDAKAETPSSEEEDGVLDVEEVLLGWNLDASLLTLSGCETAASGGMANGEMFGFTPALLGVGARHVLSSVWPVDDAATALLMDRFYDDLTGKRGAPMPPARALREAKRYLRTLEDDSGRRPFEHPAYWAGFVLTGLPGR